MRTISHHLICYHKEAVAYIKSQVIQHRWGLIFFLVGLAMGYLTSFFGLYLILDRFKTLNGWSFGEVAFIYILCLLSGGFSNMFFVQFRLIGSMVEQGQIDRILIRPLSPMVQIMGSRFEINNFANVIIGIFLLMLLRNQIPIQWNLILILLFIIVVISTTLVHSAIVIFIGSMAFIFIRTQGLDDVYSTLRDFAYYPINLYQPIAQFVLTFIFPLAFVSFVPAGIFLHNSYYSKNPIWLWYLSPLIGFILFLLSCAFWKLMLRSYQSTGS